MVSFAEPRDLPLVAEVCQSFALDNGAFSFWKAGKVTDWPGYYECIEKWHRHPGFDWALIPDVIDGTEEDNDKMLNQWPEAWYGFGVPVWHLHESLERLEMLCDEFQRVAIGSSGQWAMIGTASWWQRISQAMGVACDDNGRPKAKLHGLRMLNYRVFTQLPFSSADSTNIARNVGMDVAWKGTYQPASKAMRGLVLAERIEQWQSSPVWHGAENMELDFMEASNVH